MPAFFITRKGLMPLSTTTRLLAGSARRSRKNPSSTCTTAPGGCSTSSSSTTSLQWETFEFSESPKWDTRFANNRTIVAANEEQLQEILHDEAQQDELLSQQLDRQWHAWQQLSPSLVQRAIATLTPYVQAERIQRMQSILQQRTGHTRFLYENPSNPSNVWACLRTIDSFGIQHVDVILQSAKYQGKAALAQKRGMRTALGSARWLTLRNHPSTEQAVRTLKEQSNIRIYASDVNPQAKDIRSIDWENGDDDENECDHPICIVMGNEETGISDEMRQLADETFYLPMFGFAESFNLSVATAVTCAYLSAASSSSTTTNGGGSSSSGNEHRQRGPIRPGDLPQQQLDCLLLKGMLNSVAQTKVAHALLKREGIDLPKDIVDLL